MRFATYPTVALFLLFGEAAFAHPPGYPADTAYPDALVNQTFLREYSMGVQMLPMEGGRIYGWKLNDKVTFGRFKGESDEFGFSVELNSCQRVEITTDGFRWRKAIGGRH